MNLEPWQWAYGAAAAMLVGISKTGVPGIAILVVPLLASAFGGRASVGIMLPMLIVGDVFAVAWYHKHTQWDKLIRLLPWVVVGMALGAVAMWATGKTDGKKDIMDKLIGGLVLLMLAIHVVKGRFGERLTPKSKAGIAGTGSAAGFATTVSNAAGPIMAIYVAAHKMVKEQAIGTFAWFFFIINLSKVPIFIYLTLENPTKPIITVGSLTFNLIILPVIILGVFIGKWLLPRISQAVFDTTILVLAAAYALKLLIA